MELSLNDLDWYWFKGNAIQGRLLQDVCLFRSHVLFDGGTRENFGSDGLNFGDIQYSDFESIHIVACLKDEILGVVRITPPRSETVAWSVLGKERYLQFLDSIDTDLNHVIEINRLMIDGRVRKLNLGRTLMYAAIALIHLLWDRPAMTIIGSAGNTTKQAAFFQNYTDYERVPEIPDVAAKMFKDDITLLKYRLPPYTKGVEWIDFFKEEFRKPSSPPFQTFRMGYGELTTAQPSAQKPPEPTV